MRCFVAIDLPENLKILIGNVQSELARKTSASISFPRRDGLHLTLKFLGEIRQSQIDELSGLLEKLANDSISFNCRSGEFGAFPRRSDPRVLVVRIEPSKKLLEIQELVEKYSSVIGIESDGKEFHPHLTIGRVKDLRNDKDLFDKLMGFSVPPMEWEVKSFHLISSRLSQGGSIYRIIRSFNLNENTSRK